MPSHLSSPPPRPSRSPHVRASPARNRECIETPPVPMWDTPTSHTLPMTRSARHVLSPHRAAPAPPPVPPLPSSPAMSSYNVSSPAAVPFSPVKSMASSSTASTMARSISSSSSSSYSSISTSSSYSQDIATPPPPSSRRASQISASPRSKSSRLLPALPLSINTQLTPQGSKSKRVAVDYSNVASSSPIGLGLEDVQIVISRDRGDRRSRSRAQSVSNPTASVQAYPTPPLIGLGLIEPVVIEKSPSRSMNRRSTNSLNTSGGAGGTPPRPARRSSALVPSPSSATSKPSSLYSPYRPPFAPSTELIPPQPDYARSSSPSSDSISTITISPATTPRPLPVEQADKQTAPPASSQVLASAVEDRSTMPMGGRKRDSAQRRLSALRGLVANLDFNQPWSFSDRIQEEVGLDITEEEIPQPDFTWACGGENAHESEDSVTESFIVSSSSEEESLASPIEPISLPLPYLHVDRPVGTINPDIADSHGWPDAVPKASPVIVSSPEIASSSTATPVQRIDMTPLRRNSFSRRQLNSTPPRRPKQSRSSSELLSRTPEPPRPMSRPRKEVFDVASSGYSKSLEPVSPLLPATPTSTWRSSLSHDEVYQRLMQSHGVVEVKRQEVMWEMCETEQSFIKSMRTVLRLFATPLRTPQGKWIDGIPSKIADLFDSLECIAHAHGIASASERDMRRRNEVLDVSAFVAMFKGWVNRLQVHEWYLLKFEAVVQEVEENVRDPDSVFGEFVRMQMKEEVLGSMSLGSMLLKPVQRLTKYPLFLKRLLDVTPHPHPAHPEILSLLSTTESIILTLQATKAREEDFEQLKSLEHRLHGLPEGFTLAVRGRKLIGQGLVARVQPSRDLAPAFGSRGRANSLHSSRGSISSTMSSSAPSTASSVSPWDFSASLTPSTCRTSAFSVSSNGSSFCSAGPPSRSNSINRASPSMASISAFAASPSRAVIRSPSSASSFVDPSHASRPTTPSSVKSGRRNREEPLTILVFDDLVILAQGLSEKGGLFNNKKRTDKGLRVLSELEGGIGKVAEVKDWSGWGGYLNLFSLTVVPISHCTRNPITPITHVFTLPAGSTMFPGPSQSPSSASLRSLRPSASSTTIPASLNLTCPTLNTLAGFMGTLAQATTSVMGEGVGVRGSEYAEEKEVLDAEVGEEGASQWIEGYAA